MEGGLPELPYKGSNHSCIPSLRQGFALCIISKVFFEYAKTFMNGRCLTIKYDHAILIPLAPAYKKPSQRSLCFGSWFYFFLTYT